MGVVVKVVGVFATNRAFQQARWNGNADISATIDVAVTGHEE